MKTGDKILGIVCTILRVLGWLGGGAGVVSFFVILIGGGGPASPRAMSIVALFLGVTYFCVFWSVAGIIKLLFDIRENTQR